MSDQMRQTCETCRFVNYTRRAEVGVTDISCHQTDLIQYQRDGGKSVGFGYPFRPPRLTFACNRWAARKPEIGFVPTHLTD